MKKIITTFIMMLCAACVASGANYLTFTAEEDGSTFGIANNKNTPDVQYSLDDGATWTALTEGDSVILAHKGDKALLKGDNPKGFSNRENYSSFTMTGKVAASGSVMSLIDGVELSTEIPNGYCFCRLFRNCTSLTQAPELPATTLAEACYSQMFASCTSLTQAPELPATTLPTASNVESGCYGYMFEGCTSLTRAPELPATTLVDNCYRDMFMGCTSLSEINVSFTSWSNSGTAEWVIDVAPTGTFICPKALALEYGEDRIPEGWTVKYTNYLTFTAEEDSSTFGIVYDWAGVLPSNGWPDIQYSLDGGVTWSKLAIGDKIILAKKGDKALIRGYNENGMGHWSTWYVYEHNYVTERNYQYNYTQFVMTGAIAASGSVMSLIDGIGETLVVPSDKCFFSLFSRCTSLTKAPELPATSLASKCYSGMFSGCTNLSEISVDFTKWGSGHTDFWIENVAPTGTFYCPKELPLEYGVDRIPEGWTVKHIEVGVNATLADNITIWTDDLTIYVRGAKGEVAIYDLSGKRVAVSYSADEERALSVPTKGVYVVRTNNGTSDVLVR